jgi:alkanesulfonate monooxygenase SsuD/methylene tetrahydromethanopterin reductase-like flavin-dependent oxidoreductase (luciferase family)
MPLCYRSTKEREEFVMQLVARMEGSTPDVARRRIMIGGKEECFDAIDRYVSAGVTHFIFMTFVPYNLDEIQRFAEEVMPAARSH